MRGGDGQIAASDRLLPSDGRNTRMIDQRRSPCGVLPARPRANQTRLSVAADQYSDLSGAGEPELKDFSNQTALPILPSASSGGANTRRPRLTPA